MSLPFDLLDGVARAQLKADLLAGIDDSTVNVEIKIWSLSSSSVNLDTGAVTRTTNDYTVNALRRTVTAEEVAESNTRLEPEDRVYLVDQEDLTGGDVQTVDRIKDGSEVLEVVEFAADPLNLIWQITAREIRE